MLTPIRVLIQCQHELQPLQHILMDHQITETSEANAGLLCESLKLFDLLHEVFNLKFDESSLPQVILDNFFFNLMCQSGNQVVFHDAILHGGLSKALGV